MTRTTELSPVILPPTPPGARAREERGSSAPAPGTLEREAVRRMVTRSMRIGMWVWPTFTIVDAWMCFVAYPGAPFGRFLLYRVVIELAMIWTYRASRRPEVSSETLH